MAGSPTPVLGNAFRVLGLPADASQPAVEQAARRMRIWPDPARIPPTNWDLPWLGPLRRTRSDIEQAVARLAEPQSRLRERLCWFLEACPVVGPAEAELETLVAAAEQAADPAAGHDAALAALLVASQVDPNVTSADRWGRIVIAAQRLGQSSALVQRVSAIEQEAQFEKRVSDAEITAAVGGFAQLAATALQHAASGAADAGDASAWVRIGRLLEPLDRRAAGRIYDGVEELLESRCRVMADDLRRTLQSQLDHYESLAAAKSADESFHQTILAVLTELGDLGPDHACRTERCGPAVAHAAAMLAECWRWVGKCERAREMLLRAVPLAQDTRLGAWIRQQLAVVEEELATEQRALQMAQDIGISMTGAGFEAQRSDVITSPALSPTRDRTERAEVVVAPQPPQVRLPPRTPPSQSGRIGPVIAMMIAAIVLMRACLSIERGDRAPSRANPEQIWRGAGGSEQPRASKSVGEATTPKPSIPTVNGAVGSSSMQKDAPVFDLNQSSGSPIAPSDSTWPSTLRRTIDASKKPPESNVLIKDFMRFGPSEDPLAPARSPSNNPGGK